MAHGKKGAPLNPPRRSSPASSTTFWRIT